MLLVPSAQPGAVAVNVKPVPSRSTATLSNVATPLTAAALTTPARRAPPVLLATASVTVSVPITVAPLASVNVTVTAGASAFRAVPFVGWAEKTR